MAEPKYKIMGNMIWFMESSEPPRQVTPIERELLAELDGVRGLLQRLEGAFRSSSPTDLWSAAKEVFAGKGGGSHGG